MGPRRVSWKITRMLASCSLSQISLILIFLMKKLKYAGNSNSATLIKSSLEYLRLGMTNILGTWIPCIIESLIVSGGMPTWTFPVDCGPTCFGLDHDTASQHLHDVVLHLEVGVDAVQTAADLFDSIRGRLATTHYSFTVKR